MGMSVSIMMWYVGGTYAMPLTISFPPSPKDLYINIQYPKITKLFVVTLNLEELIPFIRQDNNNGSQAMARLKFVVFGGAACPADIYSEMVKRGIKLINLYGSTEMGYVCINPYDATKTDQLQTLRPLHSRQPNIRFLPIETDSKLYELTVLPNDPFLAPEYAAKGQYSSSDLFLEYPSGSGHYIIQGRKDDTLVHTTGEKTNPLPIELAIRQHPIVKHAVVLGHGRFCCSVLIELNIDEAVRHESRSIEEQILSAVKVANKDAPTHSHIVPSLVKILPLNRHLPITGKGNIIRNLIDHDYDTMIDEMYAQYLNGIHTTRDIQHPTQKHSWTRNTMHIYLQTTIARILDKPIELFADYSKSPHSLSLNSLTVVELRHVLCREFGQLEQNIIYEFPSINALADELLRILNDEQIRLANDPEHYEKTEAIINKYIDLLKVYKEQTIISSEKQSDCCESKVQDQRVVLITGANGSLGSEILLQLIRKPQVTRIYCLLRGNDAKARLRYAMETRAQDSSILLDTTRIIILPMDLSDDKLGQTEIVYNQFQYEVTDIIHSAWKMDFNMNIEDFDRECLQGLFHLLKLASCSKAQMPMHFHFVSSISAAGSCLFNEIEEELLPRGMNIALAQGYGQSKYAGEHICWAAMNLLCVSVDIYRFGQISGSSETGAWNTAEMIPLMICAGVGEFGVLPNDFQRIDWIPVNYAAASLVEIAMNRTARWASPSERVHHILNPHAISWSQLLEYLKFSGLEFKTVPVDIWLRMLLDSPKNPAYTLAGFFEKVLAKDKKMEFGKFKMAKTIHRATILKCCPPINQEILQCYLKYWWKVGFLKRI